MKNGLERNTKSDLSPALPIWEGGLSADECVDFPKQSNLIWKEHGFSPLGETGEGSMKNGLGHHVNAGLKPPAQYVEAISTSSIQRLRAGAMSPL